MGKNDFSYNQAFEQYEYNADGIIIEIDKDEMCDETLELAEKVLKVYPTKIPDISSYLTEDDGIKCCYGEMSPADVAAKLHKPIIKINKLGGVLTYCNHELDQAHIIDVEFGGVLETFFYVSMDG